MKVYSWLAHPSHEAKLSNARIERGGVVATTRDWKVVSALGEKQFITGPLADNLHRVRKDLTGRLAGYRSARRGDYRVVIKIIEVDQVVLVDRIDHRSHVYRPRSRPGQVRAVGPLAYKGDSNISPSQGVARRGVT